LARDRSVDFARVRANARDDDDWFFALGLRLADLKRKNLGAAPHVWNELQPPKSFGVAQAGDVRFNGRQETINLRLVVPDTEPMTLLLTPLWNSAVGIVGFGAAQKKMATGRGNFALCGSSWFATESG